MTKYFTTKCGILPQSVVIPWGTLLRIVVFYYKIITNNNILLQNVILYHKALHFLLQSVVFPMISYILKRIVVLCYKI